MFNSINQLVERALSEGISLSEVMIQQEMEQTGQSYLDVYNLMKINYETMENAVQEGIAGVNSTTGLTGMDAVKMQKYIDSGKGPVSYTHLTLPTILLV